MKNFFETLKPWKPFILCCSLLILCIAAIIVLNSYVLNMTHGYYNIFDVLFM